MLLVTWLSNDSLDVVFLLFCCIATCCKLHKLNLCFILSRREKLKTRKRENVGRRLRRVGRRGEHLKDGETAWMEDLLGVVGWKVFLLLALVDGKLSICRCYILVCSLIFSLLYDGRQWWMVFLQGSRKKQKGLFINSQKLLVEIEKEGDQAEYKLNCIHIYICSRILLKPTRWKTKNHVVLRKVIE